MTAGLHKRKVGGRAVYICAPKIYTFEGVTFEVHSYFGPWPLNKDGSVRARAGRSFWSMWDRFKSLPAAEKERYRV